MYPFEQRSTGPAPSSPRDEAERLLGARRVARPMLVGGGLNYYFASLTGYTDEDNPTGGLSSGGGYLAEDDGGAHRKHLFLRFNQPLTFGRIRAISLGDVTVTCWPSSNGYMQFYPILENFDASLSWNTEGALSYYTSLSYPCGDIAIGAAPAPGSSKWYQGIVYPSGLLRLADVGANTAIYGLKVQWIAPLTGHVLASFSGAGAILAVPG